MNIMEVMQRKNLGKKYMADGMEFTLVESLSSLWLQNEKTQEVIEDTLALDEIVRMDFKEIVDWSKVPVDTKVLVSDNGEYWARRYFAEYVNGEVYVFTDGRTSFTIEDDAIISWKYVKLYEE